MVPVFRLCVMFVWCVLFPADLAQAKCVLVLQQDAEIQHYVIKKYDLRFSQRCL
jgi:hypothetical protein